jgi:16S rRNA (adenine1518-N6/adenine1519-N6)-dimethyltransferase
MSPAKFAQHFLVDKEAISRIVEALQLKTQDWVLEIGPGRGALTKDLIRNVERVVAIEIDPTLINIINSSFANAPNFKVIHADVLKFKLAQLGEGPYKVAGNLPYNLTSPILSRLSDWTNWTEAVIMVQKEVGDRLCAEPGSKTYGALTVGMNLTCEMEHVFDLFPKSFRPPPKVKSSVVKLRRRHKPLTPDILGVQKVIQAAFQQRRKTIENSLSHGLQMDKDKVRKVIDNLKLSPKTRAETLTPQHFIDLAKYLENM